MNTTFTQMVEKLCADYSTHVLSNVDHTPRKNVGFSIGGLYELHHKRLPPESPNPLKFIRVAMVVEINELNITVRYPSMQALRVYFTGGESEAVLTDLPKTSPDFDEKFVMKAKDAKETLFRYITPVEFLQGRPFPFFWLVPLKNRELFTLKMKYDGSTNDETSVQGLNMDARNIISRSKTSKVDYFLSTSDSQPIQLELDDRLHVMPIGECGHMEFKRNPCRRHYFTDSELKWSRDWEPIRKIARVDLMTIPRRHHSDSDLKRSLESGLANVRKPGDSLGQGSDTVVNSAADGKLKKLEKEIASIKKDSQEILLLMEDQNNGDGAIVTFTECSSENSDTIVDSSADGRLMKLEEDMASIKEYIQEILLLMKDQNNGAKAVVPFMKCSSENSDSEPEATLSEEEKLESLRKNVIATMFQEQQQALSKEEKLESNEEGFSNYVSGATADTL